MPRGSTRRPCGERLRGDRDDGDAERLATHVDASLEAVEDILGALLEISHLDAGATKTEVTTFDIGNLLHQLEIEFEPAARGRGLRLKIVGSSARVISDRRLLRRLLQNLISNAVKYTVEGRVLVGVRRVGRQIGGQVGEQVGDQMGEQVLICVHDTGVGIPEASRARIFREFERLPNTNQGVPGAGLGLSIVERLSRVLDHEIGLRSELGRGSIFSVRVPIDAAANRMPATAMFPRAQQPRQRSLDGLHVAAIDNERDILVAMESLLYGWDCVAATGVDLAGIVEALARGGFAPDVIIADYHIGESNGLDIIASLRALYGPCPRRPGHRGPRDRHQGCGLRRRRARPQQAAETGGAALAAVAMAARENRGGMSAARASHAATAALAFSALKRP